MIAAKAVALREASGEDFRRDQAATVRNARALAGRLASRGFRIVSGGTDCHLFLTDVFEKGMTGQEAETLLGEAGIAVNKNAIPFDTQPPMKASGLRIGTPSVTSRGMREKEMTEIADLIAEVLDGRGRAGVREQVCRSVANLCRRFPFYEGLLSTRAGSAGTRS
jgi:glycine hydroxymethyltransferase